MIFDKICAVELEIFANIMSIEGQTKKGSEFKDPISQKKIWFTEISDTHEISTEPSLKIKLITCFEFDCRRKTLYPFLSYPLKHLIFSQQQKVEPCHSILCCPTKVKMWQWHFVFCLYSNKKKTLSHFAFYWNL